MKHIKNHGRRWLAVLLAAMILLPATAFFASAEAEASFTVDLEVYYGRTWADIFAVIETDLEELPGVPKLLWEFKKDGEPVSVRFYSYSGYNIEAYGLENGDYEVILTVTIGGETAAANCLFSIGKSPNSGLDADVLEYAVYETCYIYDFDDWQYTPDSWNKFDSVYWKARFMLYDLWGWYDEDSTVYTQDDVDAMLAELLAAYNGLVKRGGIWSWTITKVLYRMWTGREDIYDWILEPFYGIFDIFEWIIDWITMPYYALMNIIR